MIKRILLTQRVDKIDKLNEIRESVDIRLVKFCLSVEIIPITLSSLVIKKYDLNTYLNNLSFDGIILSGGNNIGEFEERDFFESQLLDWAKTRQIPVLGICRGLQMINHYQNGSLIPIKGHCRTRHLIKEEFCLDREVNSFHNYGLFKENLGYDLLPLAFAEDDSIEAIKHKFYPWLAIMWHPEREDKFNKKDLEIFLTHFK